MMKKIKNEIMKLFCEIGLKVNKKNCQFCNICNRDVFFIESAGKDSSFTRKNIVIDLGKRRHAVCPYCGSYDRFRWLWYLIEKKKIIQESDSVLHFAPELGIDKVIRLYCKNYVSGDISVGRADEIIDITDIQYKDETFDVVLACQILEHIPDEARAIREIKRVIKKNGKLIISVPIAINLEHMYEDCKTKTNKERLAKFGQEDHVRIYGKDFKTHFEKFGLNVTVYTPRELLEKEEIKKMGLIENDIIMVCTRETLV